MANKYTYFIGKRVDIIADSEAEATDLLEREDYTSSVIETHLLVIGHDITEEGKVYHHEYRAPKEVTE